MRDALLFVPCLLLASCSAPIRAPEDHAGWWQSVQLLKRQLDDPRPEIRIRACEALTRGPWWGQDGCWDLVDAGDGRDLSAPSMSRQAERKWRQATADPDRWWKNMSARFTPDQILDRLRLLTAHKDPRIREKYCRFLRDYYPGETDCGCDPPPQKLRDPMATTSSILMVSLATNGSPYFTPIRLP